ncbi:MAG: LamG domain-containing protein [Phycisphaerales bacterium]|nr:MAG: LamG domain-containing protein [Phycisphaerales bacterium]
MNDSSGNSYSGTLVGGPQWQPDGGKVGGALAFDGVDDYIDCGVQDGLNLINAVSVSAWIKLAGPAQDQKIVGNQDNLNGGFKIGIYENKPEMEIRDSGNSLSINRFVEGGTKLEPDTWYHIVGTYCQGESIKTYVNGKLDREEKSPKILAPSAGPLKVGCEPFQDFYWFKGLMDDLQIYNYPLTETEVAALYSGQAPLVVAQIQAPAVSAEEPEKASHWIPVSVIMALAIAVGAFIVRKKKMTA